MARVHSLRLVGYAGCVVERGSKVSSVDEERMSVVSAAMVREYGMSFDRVSRIII